MKVCIYGAGAIGGFLGHGLAEVDGVELVAAVQGAALSNQSQKLASRHRLILPPSPHHDVTEGFVWARPCTAELLVGFYAERYRLQTN